VTDGYIWAVVIGMGVSNYALRLLPIALLSRLELPRPILRWLSFIPVSVLAALVTVEVLRPNGSWLPLDANPFLFAAVPTAYVFYKTHSLLGATLAGIALFVAFRTLIG
jgi:branched-subunit amino acid transport protein